MTINLGHYALDLNQPVWLLLLLPWAVLMLWLHRRRLGRETIAYSGMEYAFRGGLRRAGRRIRYRMALFIMILVLLILAWTGPGIRTGEPLLFGPAEALNPVYLLAVDVSGSMTEPLGGYVVDGELNIDGPTRFQATRDAIYDFNGRHPGARLGMILFSVQPMLVRWPTTHREAGFRDVLGEGMRFTNPSRKRTSQLARFAGGTATRAGLAMARDTLTMQGGLSRSLILIGDLNDNIDEVITGVSRMVDGDTYIHIVALDALPENLTRLTGAFDGDDTVHIFPVNSANRLGQAFHDIEAIEETRHAARGGYHYLQDLRWLLALCGFIITVVTLVLFETRLHRTNP